MRAISKIKGSILCAAVAALILLLFCLRPLFAERLDLAAYTPARDSERYVSLPFSEKNFTVNSLPGYSAGRYYLKGKTAAAVLAAYARLARDLPERPYIYGETGWSGGGSFWPHRTHRNGLSIDFITPVYTLDKAGNKTPTTLPCNVTTLWGYSIRLDAAGRYKNYVLDAPAMIAHLVALAAEAPAFGLRVERVIFDPPLLKLLRKTPGFAALGGMRFMENQAWFPHDGHYHVDFTEQ